MRPKIPTRSTVYALTMLYTLPTLPGSHTYLHFYKYEMHATESKLSTLFAYQTPSPLAGKLTMPT